MILKFNNGKIKLWQGVGKRTNFPNIGIKFHKSINQKEINESYEIIKCVLESKYGKPN